MQFMRSTNSLRYSDRRSRNHPYFSLGVVRDIVPFLVADTRLYTLPCRSVGPSVRPSVGHISELRAVFAFLLLPNRPRLDCRVSGLVYVNVDVSAQPSATGLPWVVRLCQYAKGFLIRSSSSKSISKLILKHLLFFFNFIYLPFFSELSFSP